MISIVCPFYNEKDNLKILIDRLLAITPKLKEDWEIVLVDDGSTDGGTELARQLIQPHPQIRLIEFESNRGLTTALYAGLEAARGDLFATLDADLQNPPEEIPRLLDLLPGHDMATGYRAARQDTFVKKMSSKIANNIRRSVIKDSINDVGCSLRVFRKRLFVESFYPYKGMHRFFPCVAQHLGFKIVQVPVAHELRRFGQAKYGLFNRILGPLWDLIAIRWIMTRKIHYKIKESHDSR